MQIIDKQQKKDKGKTKHNAKIKTIFREVYFCLFLQYGVSF